MQFRNVFIGACTLFVAGCAAIQVTPQGAAVELVLDKPQACRFVGEAIGSQGNSLTGDFTKDSDLLMGARNDLRNKAAAMGGNVVHVQNTHNSSAFGSLGTTNSSVIGNVYFCQR
ncbi:MAG: DUF4156 domain-containing protein [Burkholderiaceae bacterium]|nr:MAG: DUF4156 domain-containing protein [Burkholderiaceae bacterium]